MFRLTARRTLAVAIVVSALILAGAKARLAATAKRAGVQPAAADLVLLGGRITTVEASQPDVQALAARGGRIVAVGTDADVKPFIGPNTRVINLEGRRAIPGFVEGHAHFTGIGRTKLNLELMPTKTWDEIVAMVAAAAKKAQPGDWILGRGWHQEKWTTKPQPNVQGFPTHHQLSEVAPENPVLLTHASGHAAFANKKAMELSGITRDTPNPPGGEIVKDAKGEPIGALIETAQRLVRSGTGERKRSPEELAAEARKIVDLASQECLTKGVTSVQDAGSSYADVDLYKKVADEGKLGVRLWVMLRMNNATLAPNLAKYRTIGYADNHVTVRAIKHSIDGALGSRGAWLLEPYEDKPGDTGKNTTTPDVIIETAKLAMQHDYQLSVHAIGDRANRETLNIFENAFKANPDKKDRRWRVEHAQHISAADIPRFGQLGVIASMQGVHCTSDAPYVLARLGPKRAEEGAYVWQKLMKSGAVVSNGTDAPVEDVDPIASYYATISRRYAEGKVFFADQRMSRLEALKSYTLQAAYAAFEEDVKGSLKVGKLADVVVLSKDIMTVPEPEVATAKVVYTIVGGKVLYEAPAGTK